MPRIRPAPCGSTRRSASAGTGPRSRTGRHSPSIDRRTQRSGDPPPLQAPAVWRDDTGDVTGTRRPRLGSAALVLVVDDPDASGFVHWVAYDLPAEPSGSLAEGASTKPGAPQQTKNDFGRAGWGGPCPPSGTHHYRFRLFALPGPLGLSGTPSAAAVIDAASSKKIAVATLTALYTRA